MERESFVFYRSFFEAVECLDKDAQADCFTAIAKYALYGEEPEIEGAARGIFISIKPQIDANNRRYENGCKGGKPKANQTVTKTEPKANQTITKIKPNENDNENENENDNDNEKIKEKINKKKSGDKPHRVFIPPTFEEVYAYCKERNNQVDPQNFIDFYSSKGWMIGKNKMKDWKAAVRTWEQRSRGQPKSSKIEIDSNFRQALRNSEVVDFGM